MGLLCHLFGHRYGEDGVCTRCGTSRGSEGLKFKKTADKQGYTLVSAAKCTDEIVTVPQFYKRKKVKEIGAGAFLEYSTPFEIELPESIERLGCGAFRNSALRRIRFSDTPCALEAHVFDGCAQLKEAAFPRGITAIPAFTYAGCASLTEVVLPDSVTAIGNSAFSMCEALRRVDYSDTLTELGQSVFAGCAALESVRLPEGMSELPAYLLAGCAALTSLTIPDSVTAIGAYALCDCAGLGEITLPEGVTSVGSGAFFGCTGLETLTFPASLTDFIPDEQNRGDVLCGCTALRELHIHPNFKHFPSGMFEGCTSLTDIYLEGGKSLDWRNIQKDEGFDEGSGTYVVHLVNGRIRKGS